MKFPFEKKNPKELLVELELYDKVFLQKKDIVKLQGKLILDQVSSKNKFIEKQIVNLF